VVVGNSYAARLSQLHQRKAGQLALTTSGLPNAKIVLRVAKYKNDEKVAEALTVSLNDDTERSSLS